MSQHSAIARAFAGAAHSYDAYASVQLSVARSLLSMLPASCDAKQALDLGCATAALARELCARLPACHWCGVDIAEPMLAEAAARGRLHARYQALCADATALPVAAASQDLVFSSFALQWVSMAAACAEIQRVLRPGGQLLLALPVSGTLRELQASWAAVDQRRHVNTLAAAPEWLAALNAAQLAVIDADTLIITEHYRSLAAIIRMLKLTGAHHVRDRQAAGLTTPQQRRQLEQAYEQQRVAAGLPLTWQVLFVLAEKVKGEGIA